jgi:multiple sugar transport system substrate-binding protein
MDMPQFQDPTLKVFKDMLPYARTLPANKNWIQITQAYFNGVQSILTGDATPQEAMDIAADEIQNLLED